MHQDLVPASPAVNLFPMLTFKIDNMAWKLIEKLPVFQELSTESNGRAKNNDQNRALKI